jgi:hypothetical protein
VAIKAPRMADGVDKGAPSGPYLSVLLSEMEASLRATRKFELVTRQENVLKELRDEQRFAKSGFAKGNAAREGEFENAHYLVIPVVHDLRVFRDVKPVPNIDGKYQATDNGILQVSAQLLDTSTGQIKSTFRLQSSFSSGTRIVNVPEGAPSTEAFTKLAGSVAAQMADQLIDAVFPMVVLQATGDQVWINRGADGGLTRGDVLTVYKPGEALIDPYTKEVLGSAETPIADVAVKTVDPKFTTAELVAGTAKEAIKAGFILRRQNR